MKDLYRAQIVPSPSEAEISGVNDLKLGVYDDLIDLLLLESVKNKRAPGVSTTGALTEVCNRYTEPKESLHLRPVSLPTTTLGVPVMVSE